jgi:bromodomain-containing factor 1
MEVSDHPLPTPPSNPPDSLERLPSPLLSEDPLAASPDLSHHAVVEAFTSDIRDQPFSPPTQSPPRLSHIDVPSADSVPEFDRPRSEPPVSMDDIENTPVTEMVNGHHRDGEYTAEDMFSGPAVESPEPTNEPTPPPTNQALNPRTAAAVTTPPVPAPASHSLAPPHSSKTSTPTDLPDTVMKDASSPLAPSKPFHEPPASDEPPAKRLKTEPLAPTYDQTKKLPPTQQKFLAALLRQVKKAKDASAFLTPVDPVKLNIPRYFEVVSRPMDISTIERKLNGGQYPVAQALRDDFNLMIENTFKFNGPDNIVTKMGRNIQATFEKGLKTLPAEQVSIFIRRC